ncbi:MAG: peroxide stress protein YaaA [Bacteroidetes bacterium]|jgi:cytoplasmic iron level regulating protein YaaA (DUF328/UPF0246 family)|nr:peroxide stress protein YaaA [Bacteroidota bacterium]
MIVLLSPAKALEIKRNSPTGQQSTPVFINEANSLARALKKLSKKKLKELFDLSDKLVDLNYRRYQEWQDEADGENTKQAAIAFNGEVYQGWKAYEMDTHQLQFAQDHVRILSGLYGILRPLDIIREYRLEMGTKFGISGKKTLYEYWKRKITQFLQQELRESDNPTVINLASNEYSKVVDFGQLKCRVITPVFKDEKNGQYKVLFTYAKKARGYMTRFIVENRITDPEYLKGFDTEGYTFNNNLSTKDEWVFTR